MKKQFSWWRVKTRKDAWLEDNYRSKNNEIGETLT